MPNVEEVWLSDAGAHLFNGISRMKLVNKHHNPVLFSKRKELTEHIIGMILEAGYLPDEFMHGGNDG